MMEAVPDLNIVRYGVSQSGFLGGQHAPGHGGTYPYRRSARLHQHRRQPENFLNTCRLPNYAVSTLDDEELNGMWYGVHCKQITEFIGRIRCSPGTQHILYDKAG